MTYFSKGKLSAAKLCSMTTMLDSDIDDKSIQSFRIPLEIVRDDSQQHHYSSNSTYGGDLLLTIIYKRNIVKVKFFRHIFYSSIKSIFIPAKSI